MERNQELWYSYITMRLTAKKALEWMAKGKPDLAKKYLERGLALTEEAMETAADQPKPPQSGFGEFTAF